MSRSPAEVTKNDVTWETMCRTSCLGKQPNQGADADDLALVYWANFKTGYLPGHHSISFKVRSLRLVTRLVTPTESLVCVLESKEALPRSCKWMGRKVPLPADAARGEIICQSIPCPRTTM